MNRLKLFKIISMMIITSLIFGNLCGCGKKSSDKDGQGRTIINVGHWPQEKGTELDNMLIRKEKFEALNSDVVVNGDGFVFDLKTFYAKAAGGQLPTIFDAPFTEVEQLIETGYVADLTEVLKKRGYEDKFNERILNEVSKDGKVYAFPFGAYVFGMAYNTDLFEKAGLMEADGTPKEPKTWDEVVEWATLIKEKTGKSGLQIATANKTGGWMFMPIAWSYGVNFMQKDENDKWIATFNTEEAVKALQFVKDLKWKYNVLPENTFVDSAEYYKNFAIGNVGMMISPGDIANNLVQYETDPEMVGSFGMPSGPKGHVTLLGGSVYCVPKTATDDQIDAAIRWIETAYNYDTTDDYKTNTINKFELLKENKAHIGIKPLSIWNKDTESFKFFNDTVDSYSNANPNHVKLYNQFVIDMPAEIRPEEPMCAQGLYTILDNCIQEVLTNENSDCASLIKKANDDFQNDYLNNAQY